MGADNQETGPLRGLFIDPAMTVRSYLEKYPLAELFIHRYLAEERERILDLTLLEFLGEVKIRPGGCFLRDTLAGWLNNVAGAYYHAPLRHGSTAWLHTGGPAPSGFFMQHPQPVELSSDGVGIVRTNGLNAPWYWACNGAFSVRYTQASGEIDSMSCWNWQSGPKGVSEQLFGKGFLSFGVGESRHVFKQACLWPFGFRNRWGWNDAYSSELYLGGRSMVLEVKGDGKAWIDLHWGARKQMEGIVWRAKGWEQSLGVYVIYVAYMGNNAVDSHYYPPYFSGFSLREIMDFNNGRTDPNEEGEDRLAAGNLYLLLRPDNSTPCVERDGVLHWENPNGIRLQISAGTTFNEALTELRRLDANVLDFKQQCLAHYQQIRAMCATVQMPAHRNIESIAATAPLLLESLKMEDNRRLRHSAGVSYVDTHTSLMSMDALLYEGDFLHVENALTYLADPVRRGPKGQIATTFHYDGRIAVNQQEWKFHDVLWLALIGRLHWHRRGAWPAQLYAAGASHAQRILAECDPETALFTSRGYWPDHPVCTVGRKGAGIWPVQEAGVWYEALRTWETLALERGELKLVRRMGAAARKLRKAFKALFFDTAAHFICDHVEPGTRRQHPHYSSFHLYFLDGMFGHELLPSREIQQMAEVAFTGLHDPSWKTFRTSLPLGPYHSELEFNELHWFLVLAKLFRRARHQAGLLALRESLEFHYGKFINYIEAFNLQPEMTAEQHDFNGWFNNCMATRYRVIIEGLFGVSLAAYNLSIWPVGLDASGMALKNLPIGASRWSFEYSGSGEWPAVVLLDGRDHSASWVFPEHLLKAGEHSVSIAFTENAPTYPVLLETAGLHLKQVIAEQGRLVVILAGPGRADVRFFCPERPRMIMLNGKKVRFTWDAAVRQAVISAGSEQCKALTVTLVV